MTSTAIASWLLTYLLHSTVLVGCALLIARILGERRLALQEVLLRAALVGGVVTASLQTGLAIQPLTGTLSLTADAGTNVLLDTTTPPTMDVATIPAPAPQRPLAAAFSWVTLLLVLWGFGSLSAAVGLGRSIVQLRRLLATRRLRPPDRMLRRIASAMGLNRSVRFSTSQAIAIPFATGIRRPEICCPERIDELAHEYRTGLFAHELAHLARRDPGWQVVYRLGEAALCLQPLNRFARRRLEEIAEHLTDERAASCTGDRLGLARCLVAVAHWPAARKIGVPAVALAAGVRLDQRVRRLLAGSGTADHCPRWASALLITLVTVAAGLLPAIAPAPANAELVPNGSDAAPVRAWSDGRAPAPDELLPPLPPAVPALEIDGELPRLPDLEMAPTIAPPAAPAPEAPEVPSAPAPAAPEIAPAPAAAGPEPPRAPNADAAPAVAPTATDPAPPDAAPAAEASPAPVIAPGPAGEAPAAAAAPTPHSERTPALPAAPEEIARLRGVERARARERAERRQQTIDEQRARAEARGREHREAGREQAERKRAAAAELALQSRLTDEQREEVRRQLRAAQAEVERIARERVAAEREQTRKLAEEARRQEREAAAHRERLTEEQREAIRRHAAELQAEAELRRRETADRARERARALATEARRLAEQKEAQRRAEEEKK